MLKLDNELNNVIVAFQKIDYDKLINYIEEVKKQNEFKNLEIRVVNDLLRATVGTSKMCEWYDIYKCNDKHITNLGKKAFRIAYPTIKLEV